MPIPSPSPVKRLLACAALALSCGSQSSPTAEKPAASSAAKSAEPLAPSPFAGKEPGHLALPTMDWPAEKQALHVLHRLAFGPRPHDVEAVAGAGVEAWIRAQMKPGTIADEALEVKLRALPSLPMSIAALHDAYPQQNKAGPAKGAGGASAGAAMSLPDPQSPQVMMRELIAQKILRATESERQLQEVLVDFWFNHFNVFADKGQVRWYLGPYERDAIRPHVFGRFRDLLGATAHHPAMLFYLDNYLSAADKPAAEGSGKKAQGLNENYGRELLELHTLGVDGGYTQEDVRQAARAFTGWTIDEPQRGAAFAFRLARHDKEPKIVLGKVLDGGGERDGEQLLDFLAAHPSTARFLATALCQKFHSDHPPPALVQRVADAYLKSGGDLSLTYEAIFTSPEFWSYDAFETKTRTPLELVAAAARAVGAQVTDPGPLSREIDKLGEPLYRCAPPTGYKETSDAWISTGGLLARINFGLALGAGRIKGTSFDRERLLADAPPADEEQLIDRLSLAVLHRPLPMRSRSIILRELSPQTTPIPYQEPSPTNLPLALGLLLGSPEMQKQ